MNWRNGFVLFLLVGLVCLPALIGRLTGTDFLAPEIPAGREEVVFWHFWGGSDGAVVDDVVARFNDSQTEFFVRAIAMPGNNLQAKLFLSVAGGDPPDLVNQDDPVLADWASRGVIQPIDSFAPENEISEVRDWMFDSAERLSTYDNRMFAVCNGLDIRALYFNRTVLEQNGLSPPATREDLDRICAVLTPPDSLVTRDSYAYLPDSRRLWAWGFVHGGDFYDAQSGSVQLATPEIIEALAWMQGYARRYGPDNIAAFRTGDQSLPGKAFPLLPIVADKVEGRYTLLMDGQWRCRDIGEFVATRKAIGAPVPEFGVCPLPPPAGNPNARQNAGWVNGNFFVVPSGAKNSRGAWEFMKFWIGFSDPDSAARTCAAGGWIPVSQTVVDSERFQSYLAVNPLFKEFVDLAGSENQFPVPIIPGAAMFKRTVESAAFEAMDNPDKSVEEILRRAEVRIQQQLDRNSRSGHGL